MEWFDRIFTKVSETIALYVVGALMIASMLYVTANVVGRYLFRASLLGMSEIVGVMLVPITYLGLSFAYYKGAYITVDILQNKLSGKAIWGFQFALLLVTLVLFSGLLWVASVSETLIAYERALTVGQLGYLTPLWIWKALMAAGLFLLIIRNVLDLIRMIRTRELLPKVR